MNDYKANLKSLLKRSVLPFGAVFSLCVMGGVFAAKQSEPLSTQPPSSTSSNPILTKDEQNTMIDSLVLVDESIPQVLGLLERLTGKILILPSNLPNAKINLNIPIPVTKEEALVGLKSVLSANGIAVSNMGEKYIKVIPVNRAKSTAPDLIETESLNKIPSSQEICSRIFTLNNLTAREAARIVYSSLTPGTSAVVTLDKANALLITDTLSNLQRIETLFTKVDQVGQIKEDIVFFELKNMGAIELKTKLENLQKSVLKRYLYGNTSFEADTRTNQLIVMAPAGNIALIRRFIERLDVNITPLTKSEVFRIKHGTSKEMTELIKKVVQQQQEKGEKEPTEEVKAEGQTPDQKAKLSLRQRQLLAGNEATSEAHTQFSNYLSIEADERSNSVVVYGTPTDIQQIGQLIGQLDVILPQVRIEVIIAEVRLTQGQVSGLETFGYKYDGKPSTITATSKGNLDGTALDLKKLSLNKFNLDLVLNTAKRDDNVTILSSPTLLTTHNREATIKVGESRPYISHSVTKLSDAGKNDPSTTSNEIKQEEAGIELKVKPLIGLNGVVQLDITQVIDDFSTQTVTAPGTNMQLPYIVKRKIQSFVTVNSGEVIVLAGLKQRDYQNNNHKMFLLGSLPVVGDALFTNKAKQEVVKELVVFIRPYALTDITAAQKDTKELVQNLTETTRTNVQHYMDKGQFKEPKLEDDKAKKKNTKEVKPKVSSAQQKKPHQHHSRKTNKAVKTAHMKQHKDLQRNKTHEETQTLSNDSKTSHKTSNRIVHRGNRKQAAANDSK